MSIPAPLPITLAPDVWAAFWAALPEKQAADGVIAQVSQECPWLYGFARGLKALGATCAQFQVKLADAAARLPKVAVALQDAQLPLERCLLADLDRRYAQLPALWTKIAFEGPGIVGLSPAAPQPKAPTPSLTAKTAPAPQVGTSRLNTYQSLPATELPKYQQRFSTPGNAAWGNNWRQNYMQAMQAQPQPGVRRPYNPYAAVARPAGPPTPQMQQAQLQTDYWLNGKLPEGTPAPADLSTWQKGSPEDVKRFQWVAERSGLDPHTLMQGFQAEQQLEAAAPNGTRAEVVSALEQLPAEQRAALRAWQWAQQTDTELYRGQGYGQGQLLKGTDPGEDSPLWAATLNDQVRQRLADNPQALQSYVGQPDDWDGLEGLARRWGVDVREKAFQDFWQQEGEKVKARGWGYAPQSAEATASGPEELMRRYARWKSRELGLLDSVQQSQDPTAFAQRFFGFRRQTPQGEVATAAPASDESAFGPGFWNNVAGHAKGVGRTALSGIGAPGAVLVDALRGDTDATYSKMMARDLLRYVNDTMGTDMGHNVEMQRPDGEVLSQPQAPGETRAIPQTTGNFGMWSGSAAPEWAQRLGYGGDVGQMQAKGDYLQSYGSRADVPWYERIGARGLGSTYNNVEVPLEFAATGGLAGGTGKALGTAGQAMGGASRVAPVLGRAGQAANVAQKPLSYMSQMTSLMGNPVAQTGAAAFGEIPIGGGERILDKQRALAQASREWGAAPDAGMLQNLTGDLAANAVETGPLALASGARSLLRPGLAGATGRAVGQRSLSPLFREGAGLSELARQTLRSPIATIGAANAAAPVLSSQLDGSDWRQARSRQQLAALYPDALRQHPETGELAYQQGTWKPALTGEGTWQSRQQDLAKQLTQASPTTTPGLFNVSEEALKQAGPDGQAQISQAAAQVTSAAKQLGPQGYAQLQRDLSSGDPQTPGASLVLRRFQQQTGLPVEDAWQSIQQMDTGSQLMIGLGLPLGLVGLLAALTSENGTLGFLTSVLGFGAATGALAHEGVFGEHAQQFTKGILDMVGGGTGGEQPQSPAATDAAAGQPAVAAAKPGAAPAATSFDALSPIAQKYKLPTDKGQPGVFDEPDAAKLVEEYITRGGSRQQQILQEMAAALPPEIREQVKAKAKKRVDSLTPLERAFGWGQPQQQRYDWLQKL